VTGTNDRALFDKPGEYGGYLQPRDVIHWLIDTVSKNGHLHSERPRKPDGRSTARRSRCSIASPTGANQRRGHLRNAPVEGLWRGADRSDTGRFKGDSIRALGEKDIRFTSSKNGKYCIHGSGWPAGEFVVQSLGTSEPNAARKIERVQLLAQRRSRAGNKRPMGCT